jgi:hypothetical protein
MRRIAKLFTISTLGLLLLLGGCGEDGNGPVEPGPYDSVVIELFDASHLPGEYFYQLWAAKYDTRLASSSTLEWIPLMEFNVTPVNEGSSPDIITTITGQVIPNNTQFGLPIDFEDYDSALITIEEPGASTGMPSSSVIGATQIPDFNIRTIGILAFPEDVDSGGVSFCQLATPTDADTLNDRSGVWFVQNLDTQTRGLALKAAPPGWIYEGWARHDDTWLSTGKFSNPGMADEFSGYSASLNPSPNFPGEDFLSNGPLGVTFPWTFVDGDSVMVTMEPNPDPEDGPFGIRLLVRSMSPLPVPRIATPLSMNDKVMPNGTLTFRRSED